MSFCKANIKHVSFSETKFVQKNLDKLNYLHALTDAFFNFKNNKYIIS